MPTVPNLTVDQMAAAAKRGAVTVATDPEVRHYSVDTIGLVYGKTVKALAGAGDLGTAAARLGNDPDLSGVPIDVVDKLVAVSFLHFARALSEQEGVKS